MALFSGRMTCIDMHVVFPSMAEQHVGFGSDPMDGPLLPAHPPVAVAAAAECVEVEERSLRRRVANRESARRARARKQRHLDELRDSAALLERQNCDLEARAVAASARLELTLLANAALRAEAAVLTRRLAAVCTQGPPPLLLSASSILTASTDMEQVIASWIVEPP